MSLGIYVGRFQPFHNAHLGIALECLKQVDRLLIVLGSAQESRTRKNPFTVAERAQMIGSALEEAGIEPWRVLVEGLGDVRDDAVWCVMLRELAGRYAEKPVLFGAEKDNTSYYLRLFPDWELRVLPVVTPMSATEVRGHFFRGEPYAHLVPPAVTRFLQEFATTPDYEALRQL